MLDMKRREFITLLGGAAAAWPLAARAQQPDRIGRIGVLNPFAENDPAVQANFTAFRQALQKLGWTDGRNARIDYRWGSADPGRIRAQAEELVGLHPDVILVSSALALQPLLQETRSIPIVFTQIADPVGAGLVASLARPGGNITGFTVAEFSTFGKLLEVLKEVAPHGTRVAVVLNPDQISPLKTLLRPVARRVARVAARPGEGPGGPGADRGAGHRAGKGQDRERGTRRVRERASRVLRRPGYVLCRQSEGRWTHLPADLHRHLHQGKLCQALRPKDADHGGRSAQ